MIIISALSYIENKNPYTQPNVEKTKNYLTDTKLPPYISNEINISNIKYASFLFFTKNKNLYINVKEFPLINQIVFKGEKAKKHINLHKKSMSEF